MSDGWILTFTCTAAEAAAIAGDNARLDNIDPVPAIVASEANPHNPDEWQVDIYFGEKPSRALLRSIAGLLPNADASAARPLPNENWVARSQQGIRPMLIGRFYIRTPDHPPMPNTLDFCIPAGLAFGTGQHATTTGCLMALNALKRRGTVFRNILDLGTGTGLLAFAAARLWPVARVTASDIDPLAMVVVRDNAALNSIRGLHLVTADGFAHRELVARAPYDLVMANILAQPLIDMAPMVSASLARGGTLLLAGLLNTQASDVERMYKRHGMRLMSQSRGEWPVLMLRAR